MDVLIINLLFVLMQAFRNVAVLGRVKLEINEEKLNQSTKKADSTSNVCELLISDSSDEDWISSDED